MKSIDQLFGAPEVGGSPGAWLAQRLETQPVWRTTLFLFLLALGLRLAFLNPGFFHQLGKAAAVTEDIGQP